MADPQQTRGRSRDRGRDRGRGRGRDRGRDRGRGSDRGSDHDRGASGQPWAARTRPTVGVPFEDNVLSAARKVPQELRWIDYDRMATTGEESRYSSMMPWQIEPFVKQVREELGDHVATFTDITGHIGGEAIVLAQALRASGRVIEINDDTFMCLRHNLEHARAAASPGETLMPLEAREGDGVDYIMRELPEKAARGEPVEDMVYADPPWGGTDYKGEPVHLKLGDRPIRDLIKAALDAGVKTFVLKTPNNVVAEDFTDVAPACTYRPVTLPTRGTPRVSFGLYFFHNE